MFFSFLRFSIGPVFSVGVVISLASPCSCTDFFFFFLGKVHHLAVGFLYICLLLFFHVFFVTVSVFSKPKQTSGNACPGFTFPFRKRAWIVLAKVSSPSSLSEKVKIKNLNF